MKSHSEKILWSWICFCKRNKKKEKIKEIWLLYDYLGQNLSKAFYQNHSKEARTAINNLDAKKPEVGEVIKDLNEVVGLYE